MVKLAVPCCIAATVQILVSVVVGGINMKYPCYMGQASTKCLPRRPFQFYVHMFYVGITRYDYKTPALTRVQRPTLAVCL